MDRKFSFVLILLVFSPDYSTGCTELVQDFLIVRDAVYGIFTMCSAGERELDDVEDVLGFPFMSDENWRAFLCDLEDAEDSSDVANVINDHFAVPIDEHMVYILLRNLREAEGFVPEHLAYAEKYQHKVQPWLAKTDFPNIWPVPNAGKKETARLMAKGNEMDHALITYGGVSHNSNYKKWAKVLLNAESLDDYLRVVNRWMVGETESQECFAAIFDLYRDNDYFAELPGIRQALVRVFDAFTDMGLYDMITEYPDYYYGK